MNKFQPIVGQRTDRGRARPRNEDAIGRPPPDLDPNLLEQKGYLYAVADGMGGEAGGQQASTLAIKALVTEYYRDPEPDVRRSLWHAVRAANQRVYRKARSTPSLARMGTTLTAAVVRGEDLVIAHVGDSRAYLIRNDQIRQLTRDHSWVADAMRVGTLSAEEARNHPNRNILTRALGSEPEVEVDVVREKLQPGDRVVLCSDGLTNFVGDGEILQRVQKLGPRKAPDALVDLANERGGHDNITAMVVSVPGGPPRRVPPRAAQPRPSGGVPWPVFGGLLAVVVVMVMVMVFPEVMKLIKQPEPTQMPMTQATATETAMPTATPTETSTATPTETPTPTMEEPTVTPMTPIPTSTVTPTPTPTTTLTLTPTATPTPTPTLTVTPVPTATPIPPTPIPTSTATPVPPTPTPIPPTPTPTPPTPTPVPPTPTSTPKSTPPLPPTPTDTPP